MKRKEEADLLTLYTDHLLGIRNAAPGGETPASTRHEQVYSLLTLADHLHAILAPVEPDLHFRRRLHGQLILKAQSREEIPEVGLLQQHRRGIVLGALGLGSVASVIGVVVAVLLRRRAGNMAAG